jgi:hypothetical protein
MSSTNLSKVCSANLSILRQKVALMDALVSRHRTQQKADEAFRAVCPLVGASIGMHLRHSMDHIERATIAAERAITAAYGATLDKNNNNSVHQRVEIHYDLRIRGGKDETDIDEARDRITRVSNLLSNIQKGFDSSSATFEHPVEAFFFLSGDPSSPDVGFHTTIGRELGFAAHHAIHHLTLVKIIALNYAGLQQSDLPKDLGMAPSTVLHESNTLNDNSISQ